MSAHAPYMLLLLLPCVAHAQPGPFEDMAFTTRSADNDPDLVVVRERFDAETRRQSIYLRSYDASQDHTTFSGELTVVGARVAEVITDGAALAESDAVWGVGDVDYGAAASRGLEGDDLEAQVPVRSGTDDALRTDNRAVRFWFGTRDDVDDMRVILEYDAEPTTAHFDVTLFGGRRADPDGFPSTSQGGIQVGSLVDRAPDDGDYSEVFDVASIKLQIEDLDIVERGVSLGSVELDGPAGPATFNVDNYAEGVDLDQDNGFDQNGILSPIASATDLQNLRFEVTDLETERGDVIAAEQLEVVGLPAGLAHGDRAAVEVSAVVPVDTAPGVYRGQVIVWEDNTADGRRGARETADAVRVTLVVGTPPDGGFDLGFTDGGLPDGAPFEPDAAPDGPPKPDGGEDASAESGDAGADGGIDMNVDAGSDTSVDGANDGPPGDQATDAASDGATGDAVADGGGRGLDGPEPDFAPDPDGAPRQPADLEPEIFDPGDARGGAFSCQTGGGLPRAWLIVLLVVGASRFRRSEP